MLGVFERLQRHASLIPALASFASVFCLATTSPDTIEQVFASLNVLLGMRLHATLKNLCVNKKHCYEKQLLPLDSGGFLCKKAYKEQSSVTSTMVAALSDVPAGW